MYLHRCIDQTADELEENKKTSRILCFDESSINYE